MRLIFGHDDAVSQWVAMRIPGMTSFGPCVGIGVMDSADVLIGGVIFHDWQPQWKNIQCSFASDRRDWLTRKLIRVILAYPFQQVGAERITTLTPKRNKAARQFLQKFGFRHEGNVRRGFGDDDAIISGLLREEWEAHRFNGQINPGPPSGS